MNANHNINGHTIDRIDTHKRRPKSSPIKKIKHDKISDEKVIKKRSDSKKKTHLHSRSVLRLKQFPTHKRELLLTRKHLVPTNTYANNIRHTKIFGINPNKIHFEGVRRKKALPILKKYNTRKATLGQPLSKIRNKKKTNTK